MCPHLTVGMAEDSSRVTLEGEFSAFSRFPGLFSITFGSHGAEYSRGQLVRLVAYNWGNSLRLRGDIDNHLTDHIPDGCSAGRRGGMRQANRGFRSPEA